MKRMAFFPAVALAFLAGSSCAGAAERYHYTGCGNRGLGDFWVEYAADGKSAQLGQLNVQGQSMRGQIQMAAQPVASGIHFRQVPAGDMEIKGASRSEIAQRSSPRRDFVPCKGSPQGK
jgi:hypothetical protein